MANETAPGAATGRAKAWSMVTAAGEAVSKAAGKCAIRLMLWLITIIGAMLPAVYAAKVQPTLDYIAIADKVNAAGLFRDLFYVTVVIALIGFCEILAELFKGGERKPVINIIYAVAIASFVFFIFYGIGEFAHLAASHEGIYVVPKGQFEYDMNILVYAGLMGLFLEFVLAFQGE